MPTVKSTNSIVVMGIKIFITEITFTAVFGEITAP